MRAVGRQVLLADQMRRPEFMEAAGCCETCCQCWAGKELASSHLAVHQDHRTPLAPLRDAGVILMSSQGRNHRPNQGHRRQGASLWQGQGRRNPDPMLPAAQSCPSPILKRDWPQ